VHIKANIARLCATIIIYYTRSKGDNMNEIRVIKWLKSTDIPLSKVSTNTGVSRRTLYNWLNGEKPNESNLMKIEKRYFNEINNTVEISGSKMELDSKYIIKLQKDKIEQQEVMLETFKSYLTNQPIQKLQWEDINADMTSTVHVRNVLSFKKMERKINITKDSKKLEKLLGLPKNHNYFDNSRWYHMDSHPIDEIIDNSSKKLLKKISNTLPSLFESFKFVVGDHYMSFPVIYKYKDKQINTMCSILLDWKSSPKKILTKSEFLI